MHSSTHTPSDARLTTTARATPGPPPTGPTGPRTPAGAVLAVLPFVVALVATASPVLAVLAVEVAVAAWYLGPPAVTLLARHLRGRPRRRLLARIVPTE